MNFNSLRVWMCAVACALLAGCGGGGGGSNAAFRSNTGAGVASVAAAAIPGANVVPIRVDRGAGNNLINTPFVTVRVCVPGTGSCVDVERVVLDTGSSGLRVLASALGGLPLPAVTQGVQSVAQCQSFASGRTWGSVRQAEVQFGGEQARVSVQVINDPALPKPLGLCGEDIGTSLGANGILGVGFGTEDCPACASNPALGVYYSCTASACTSTSLLANQQVANPVAFFANNNNGVTITLPSVPAGGAGVVTGWLLLGVNTQANNQLGSASIYRARAVQSVGYVFSTTYKGVNYDQSFIDSGSNGYFFEDTLTSCGDFYCFDGPLALSAVNTSAALPLTSASVDFILDSVTRIRDDAAAAHIGGSLELPGSFDWGLPFFYGRTVFTVRDGQPAGSAGSGPFWAY